MIELYLIYSYITTISPLYPHCYVVGQTPGFNRHNQETRRAVASAGVANQSGTGGNASAPEEMSQVHGTGHEIPPFYLGYLKMGGSFHMANC